jgi:hypothetical protein
LTELADIQERRECNRAAKVNMSVVGISASSLGQGVLLSSDAHAGAADFATVTEQPCCRQFEHRKFSGLFAPNSFSKRSYSQREQFFEQNATFNRSYSSG